MILQFSLFLSTLLMMKMVQGVYVPVCSSNKFEYIPYPGDCTRYIQCNYGQAIVYNCSFGGTFDSEQQRCIYSPRMTHCEDPLNNQEPIMIYCPRSFTGRYPHPLDCKKFIACGFGTTYNMDCAPATVYNPLTQDCDWPHNVPGCYGDFGNSLNLRGDVTFSTPNYPNEIFRTPKAQGPEFTLNNSHENSATNHEGIEAIGIISDFDNYTENATNTPSNAELTTIDPFEKPSDTTFIDTTYIDFGINIAMTTENNLNEFMSTRENIDTHNDTIDVAEPPFPMHYIPIRNDRGDTSMDRPITPLSGQSLRLSGKRKTNIGYVEVQGTQPGWGLICNTNSNWTLEAAHIICHQLGYSNGAIEAWKGLGIDEIPSWLAASNVECYGNETWFQNCKFEHNNSKCKIQNDAIAAHCSRDDEIHCREDEVPYDGYCYYLSEFLTTDYAEATDYCTSRNSDLLFITKQKENDFISEWLRQEHPEVDAILTSGIGINTSNGTIWYWGKSGTNLIKFTKWWSGWNNERAYPPSAYLEPLCIVMKQDFPLNDKLDSYDLTDYFFWDAEECITFIEERFYVCKRPYSDISAFSPTIY